MSARSLLGANGPQTYLDLIHQYQPKPAAPADEKPFTDDIIHRICITLDVAASPFKVAGVFFPPLKAVAEAIGAVNKLILNFSNQDLMAEFVKRINAKITALSAEMNKGFDNLEEVITDVNFLAEVVSPARELFAAFTRFAASQSLADKEEFKDCYDEREIGGLSIILTMVEKLKLEKEKNLLYNVTKNNQYGQKKFEETVKYICNTMYHLYVAHTFHLMQEPQSKDYDEQATRFMEQFQKVVARLEELNIWKESAYFDKDFLKPIIEQKTKGQLPAASARIISDWLTNTYTWDTFLVVLWDDDYSTDDDSYYKTVLSKKGNTLQLKIYEDRSAWNNYGTYNVIIHRFRDKKYREPIDYAKRHVVLEAIADRLENDRSNEFNVLNEAKIPENLGFGFWSHYCQNNICIIPHKIWSVQYAHSTAAKDEFYYFSKRTGGGVSFGRMRANVLFATY